MKIKELDTPAKGTWARDCELICLPQPKGFRITYRREEDDTYWSLDCALIIAYKVTSEEFSICGYLVDIPGDGAFYEILDSPWIREFSKSDTDILDKCRHYVLQFYDETVEIIAQEFVFKQLEGKPDCSN